MSDCLPHFLWQQSIASPPPQSASVRVRPPVGGMNRTEEGNRPNKTLFIVAAVGRPVARSLLPFSLSPLPSKANKEVKGVDGPPLSSSSLWLLEANVTSEGKKFHAQHGRQSTVGPRPLSGDGGGLPFVAAPFSAQSDIDPVPALSISYLRAFPGLDPVLSHPYKRQVYELEVILNLQ